MENIDKEETSIFNLSFDSECDYISTIDFKESINDQKE